MTNGRCGSAFLDQRRDAETAGPLPAHGDAKRRLRQAARSRRAALPADERARSAAIIADRVTDTVDIPASTVLAGYVPVGAEVDVMPLLLRLAGRIRRLALPAVVGRDCPLVFRAWAPGDDLMDGRYDIPCPLGSAATCQPTAILVPLLAFDRRGRRLGQGAGYYDRTLAALRCENPPVAIGIAFAAQEIPTVPTDDHDQPLDWIVTERDAICVGT